MLKWLVTFVAIATAWVYFNDSGSVTLHFREPKSDRFDAMRDELQASGVFQAAVDELDDHLILPQNLSVEFAECGVANAFYHPDRVTIQMCYELVERHAWGAYRRYRADSAAAVAVYQSVLFMFYHEVGHALVHLFSLPITGREEDAVDQLAAWVLLEAGPDGRDAALQGALTFLDGSTTRGRATPSWDTHSLDRQRYYNLVCWIYGSNPAAHSELLRGGWGLPRARAQSCEYEYQRLRSAWEELLVGRFI